MKKEELKTLELEELWELLKEDQREEDFECISKRIDEILDESNSVEEAFHGTDLRFFGNQQLLDYAYEFYYYKQLDKELSDADE